MSSKFHPRQLHQVQEQDRKVPAKYWRDNDSDKHFVKKGERRNKRFNNPRYQEFNFEEDD